jgi:hypothetical protein
MERSGYNSRRKMGTAVIGRIVLSSLKFFWRELFMIFCHVFWLTEISGQSFNDAQSILLTTIAKMSQYVKHFKMIHTNQMPGIISTI